MKCCLSLGSPDRAGFIAYAQKLLNRHASLVELVDHSGKTPNQNAYLHVLMRIVASETGHTEEYVKQVYLKKYACPHIFRKTETNNDTGEIDTYYRSESSLSISEVWAVINDFIIWADETLDLKLPEASGDGNDNLVFASEQDRMAYEKAEIDVERASRFIGTGTTED